MKKIAYSVLSGWLLLSMLNAQAGVPAAYLEGIDYKVINPQPVETGNKIEVREFFWYGCSHCYSFEPTLKKWLKTAPKNAKFVHTPAIFGATWELHARAYFAFEALGVAGKLHSPFFDAIHKDRQPMGDVDSIATFVAKHGVDKQKFREAFQSFSVDAAVKKAIQAAPQYGVDAVPTLVVDGKYLTTGSLAKSNERMMQVVDFLINKAAAERRNAKK